MSIDAIVAGHLCLDVIPDLSAIDAGDFSRAFAPGRLLQVGAVSFSTGGPVANVGLALHKLGLGVKLMGKVGDDLFGQAIHQGIACYDPALTDGMIIDPAAASSYTIVITPPGSDRFFLHCPGANDTFGAEDVRYDLLPAARLFHFGYPPLMRRMYEDGGAQLAEILRRAKATGFTTSLDMALPDPASAAGRADWPRICAQVLPYVDIFLPSLEEILFMLRRPTYAAMQQVAGRTDILPLVTPDLLTDLSEQLLAMGARVVGLKLGERGLYLRTAGERAMAGLGRARPSDPAAWADKELWAPCFKVKLVGAAGSGDSTIAGFLAGLLRGLSPEATVTAAVAVGACNVEAADTLSGLRSWEETTARVAAGWERHPLGISAGGWRFEEGWGCWVSSPGNGQGA